MGNEGSKSGDILLHALEDLNEADFKRFKDKLSDIDFKGQPNIPRGRLEKADRIDTKNLLVECYGSDSAIDVTIEVFTKVSLMEPAARLREERQRVLDPHETREVPGATSDFRRIYMKHIAERYRWIKDRNARRGERVPLQKRYTKLLIVEKPRYEQERQHEIMSYGEEHTEMMDRLAHSKHYIRLDTLLDTKEDGHRPRTIVLQGPAGIGKTITAQKIMLDWARGELYQELIDYMFYLSCREINQVKTPKSFIDVIAACCPDKTIPRSALLADPNKILFIVDGFDELKFSLDLKEDQQCSDPFQKNPVEVTLSNLLRRNILSRCTIIITTRPKALAKLFLCIKAPLCAEIIGFTKEDRESYFNGFFDDNKQASQVLAVVKDNDALYTMCFLPIVCWIVCTVMKQQMEKRRDIENSSKTTTSIYLFFLSTLLRDHSGTSPETMQRSLKKLCSMALNGIFEQRILFDEEDLRQFDLEVSDIKTLFLNQDIFQQDIDVCTAHSFIHLSFQEFFAALFYILDLDVGSLNPPRDLKHLLKEYSEHTKGHLMLTVRFLFGLIGKDQLRHVEEKLGFKISHSTRDDLVAWIQEPKDDSLLVDVFHCLHETQDGDIISRTMNKIQNINIEDPCYRVIDFKALSFCLKDCQGDKTLSMVCVLFGPKIQEIMKSALIKCSTLRLHLCFMEDEDSFPETWFSDEEISPETLFSEYKPEPNISVLCKALMDPSCRLKKLTLSECNFTVLCCAQLARALKANHSLTKLDLNDRNIGDEEMKAFCKELKDGDIRVQTFSLRFCRITGASCADLAAFLHSNHSLLELDLNFNKLGDDGASLLFDVLKEPDNRLQKIHLSRCGITRSSCADLAASLRTNRSLLVLNLWGNELGDDGASLLCDVLKEPDNRLQQIYLTCCGITGASCADLAASLRTNRSLLELDLWDNALGDNGASLLFDVLKEPDNRLQKISLSRCGITGASCADLAASLRTNRSLVELDLTLNKLGDNGASLLCNALKEPDNRLQKIGLSECGITGASCADLAASLRTNRSLLELKLSRNALGDSGVSLLYDALKKPDNRLQKISLSACGITGASCADLATSLRSNRSLLELDLSMNALGDNGASLLCDALKKPGNRLQKMKIRECSIDPSVLEELKRARPELEIEEW